MRGFMPDTRRAASRTLASLLTAVVIAACGEADRVEIATVTPAPAVQEVQRTASPAPSPTPATPITTPTAEVSPPAVRTSTAVPSPSPTGTPTPPATGTASTVPAGCTAESVLSQIRPSLVRVVNNRGEGRFSVGSA